MQAVAKTLTVLVVDDQSAIRDVIEKILEKTGRYAVAKASSAAEAVGIIRHDPPDVVVLDISMPGGPGLGVIPVLRRMEAQTKIVVLSAHREMKADVLALGAHAFLPKTTPSKQILATLDGLGEPT